jgi:hypothetical protein
MKFTVFGMCWAGGMKQTPLQILEKYCANKPVEIPPHYRYALHYEIDISGDELIKMSESKEFDILISGNQEPRLLAFDAVGRRFTQR